MLQITSPMKDLYPLLLCLIFLISGCKAEETPKPSPAPDPSPIEAAGISYLALGDSYTIGESVLHDQRYPVQLAQALVAKGVAVDKTKIVAQTGWTTSELKKGIMESDISGNTYELVSLLIGVNNQYRGRSLHEYRREFTALLVQAITFAGEKKERVFVLSIPDWRYTPFGETQSAARQEEISTEIDLFNAANQHIADSMGVAYFNITPISREGLQDPELVAADGLHPSGKMYAQWVALMLPKVYEMVQQP